MSACAAFGERLGVRRDSRPQMLVRLRIAGRHARSDDAQLGPRIVDRRAGRQAAEDRHGRTRARRKRGSVHAQRRPDALAHGEAEAFRHHADDRCGGGAQLHRSTHHCRITREACLPQRVTDDDHRRLRRLFILLRQRTTQQRCRPHQPERVGRDLRSPHRLHAPVLGGEVAHEDNRRAQVVDRLDLLAPDREVVQRSPFGRERVHVPVANRDHTVGIRESATAGSATC